MIGLSARWLLAVGAAASVTLGARPLTAQDAPADSEPGAWVSVGLLAGSTVLDGNASRGWQRVGHPGPSIGGSAGVGYDFRHVGGQLGAEASALSVGGRPGS